MTQIELWLLSHTGMSDKNNFDKRQITVSYGEKYKTIRAQYCIAFAGLDTMQSARMHPAGHHVNQKPSAPINQDPLRHMQSVACQSEDWSVISMNLLVQKQPPASHSTSL